MDCTYHRLNSNKVNGVGEDRRSSQVGLNGNGSALHPGQPQVETSNLNGMTGINQTTDAFPGFRGSFPLAPGTAVPSPPRMLPPPLSSPSMGMFGLQHPSPQDRLNHISPPNHNLRDSSTAVSPYTFPAMPTSGPSLMDLSHAATAHQPVFSQNLDLNSGDTDVMFASSDPSDMIFNNQFTADDTFFTWKPFEYNMNSDASLDFLFGPDLGFYDIGYSPNDPQLGEIYVPPTMNTFDDEKVDKEEAPDQGIVATFDPGPGDHTTEDISHSHPPSRTGPRSVEMANNDVISLLQIDPLQARCDSLSIAVFGSLELLHQQEDWIQDFFTTDNMKSMLFLWAKRWAQHVPIIHLPTFSILTAPDALLFVLCVIGKAYSRTGIDTDHLQWCIEAFNKLSSMARMNGELDMVNLEAVYILVVLCTWHGNKHQRDMAKALYREVVDMARKGGYCHVAPQKASNGSDDADWKAWIEQETRIRYFRLDSIDLMLGLCLMYILWMEVMWCFSILGRCFNSKKFNCRSPATELYGQLPQPQPGEKKCKNLENEHGYHKH